MKHATMTRILSKVSVLGLGLFAINSIIFAGQKDNLSYVAGETFMGIAIYPQGQHREFSLAFNTPAKGEFEGIGTWTEKRDTNIDTGSFTYKVSDTYVEVDINNPRPFRAAGVGIPEQGMRIIERPAALSHGDFSAIETTHYVGQGRAGGSMRQPLGTIRVAGAVEGDSTQSYFYGLQRLTLRRQ